MFGGATTSSIPIVTPDLVAQWKPASLSASRAAATSTLGYVFASSFTITVSCFLLTSKLTNGKSPGSVSLKMQRPSVVDSRIGSPCTQPSGSSVSGGGTMPCNRIWILACRSSSWLS